MSRRNISIAFGQRCEQAGACPSTGRTGTCFDNALAESFFASLIGVKDRPGQAAARRLGCP